ncbi:hypothetical protein [Bacillus tuaregi]|uniref:hypothetical protein n=1 Tax=Bacillus tuaregi TaxID=1816695 RepID=UPI0008F90CFD|nr:hypothetical protein [Bacillus tuaregi]
MRKLVKWFIASFLALSVLVGCEESSQVEKPVQMEESEAPTAVKHDIDDVVIIKEAVHKEGITPNGEKVIYVYEAPVILVDKPGAQKINNYFQALVSDLEARVDNGQLMPVKVEAKAYLNDGILSLVMDVHKTGSEGIYAVNYQLEKDQELSTKELLEKYQFEPQRLITEITRQKELNESKPEEERDFFSIDYFVDTIITNSEEFPSQAEYVKRLDEILQKPKEEKEDFVMENIDKIKAYMNSDAHFVFIHRGALEDVELVVQ